VWQVTRQKTNGTILDIGAWPVNACSNSYALEQHGWHGLMVDLVTDEEGMQNRHSLFLMADAIKVNWLWELRKRKMPMTIDFLSLDVDDATADTLLKMPLNILHFGIICIEHDSYRIGPGPRNVMRALLKQANYHLICEDVLIHYPEGETNAFEDWWVSKSWLANAERFRCKNKLWSEIVGP